MYKFFTAALVLALGAQAIELDAEKGKAAAAAASAMPFPAPKCGKKPAKNPLNEKCNNKIFAKLDKDSSGDISL